MNHPRKHILFILALLLTPAIASAVKIADITSISGQQHNILQGWGIVVGLKGTGDGGDYAPAMRPLREWLTQFNNPTTLAELGKSANVALVTITCTIPKDGMRTGDRFDVTVQSIGAASTLRGGVLMNVPLYAGDPKKGWYGFAQGTVTLEDPATPTSGVIKQGFQAEYNLRQKYVSLGGASFTLVIDESQASWGTAHYMAETINGLEGVGDNKVIAVARDPRTVEVQIPEPEREHPDGFISRVLESPLSHLPQEARVTINTKTNTLIVSGDVEIAPVVISYKGLTVTTVTPRPVPNPKIPEIKSLTAVPVHTGELSEGPAAKLQDLVSALEQLRVPTEDRIKIIIELHRQGKIRAKLYVDGVTP